jgi:PmbA protein
MISEKYKHLAQQLIAYAEGCGCSAVRISVATGTERSFEYRNTQLESLQQSATNQLTLNLFVDGRYGLFSTNRMEVNELKAFVKNAIDSTRYLAEDPHRALPAPDRYYRGTDAPDAGFDRQIELLRPEDMLQLGEATVEEVYRTDERLISVTASYGDSEEHSYLADSNGFEGEKAQTTFTLSAEVSLKGDGNARPEAWWYDTSLFLEQLQKKGIGTQALQRALSKLGQGKIESGKYPMIVDNRNAGKLLVPLISAMSGNALAQKDSFLLDKVGEKIASEKLTLTDAPHLPLAQGSRWFDSEGVATRTRAVIEKGVLKTCFIDTYNANRLAMEPTIGSASVLTFQPGSHDRQGLTAQLNKGILVTGFNGGNSNSATGDFSFGIEGFLIENGQLIKPISEMNITGNMLTLWSALVEIGNDAHTGSAWRTPSLLFDQVSFSGLSS